MHITQRLYSIYIPSKFPHKISPFFSPLYSQMANMHSSQYHNCNLLIPPIIVTLNSSHFYLFLHDAAALSGPGFPRCRGFTITLGRTPLDEWSTRCRYLYITTQHSKEISMPPTEFAPGFPANECPQTHVLDRARPMGSAVSLSYVRKTLSLINGSLFHKEPASSRQTFYLLPSTVTKI
jgi:hypothetical protein